MSQEKCPCGSGHNYLDCCQLYHLGTPAPSPEKLMRSRYTAFAKCEIQYLVDTQHPDTRTENMFSELDLYCRSAQFLGLQIINSTKNTVEFIATVMHEGQLFEQRENSLFEKTGPRWYYKEALSHS